MATQSKDTNPVIEIRRVGRRARRRAQREGRRQRQEGRRRLPRRPTRRPSSRSPRPTRRPPARPRSSGSQASPRRRPTSRARSPRPTPAPRATSSPRPAPQRTRAAASPAPRRRGPRLRQLAMNALVDLQQRRRCAAVSRGSARIAATSGRSPTSSSARWAALLVAALQRLGRELEVVGDRVQDLLGRLAQPALDLRQVRVGDADEVRQLAHRELLQLALAADVLAQRGARRLVHRPSVRGRHCGASAGAGGQQRLKDLGRDAPAPRERRGRGEPGVAVLGGAGRAATGRPRAGGRARPGPARAAKAGRGGERDPPVW